MSRRVLLAAIFAVMAVLALALKPGETVTGRQTPYQPALPIATDGLPLHLEALTWTEVRALVQEGKTVAIVPTGGTEQNGPHVVLGKHNYIVRHTAERVAARLGNALVAPVMTYVPEGRIDPPEGHMATYLKSLHRVLDMDIGTLCPAHGPAARDGSAVLRHFLVHRQEREEKLVAALGEEPRAEEALLPVVYDDVKEEVMGLAARSLRAGLDKLAEEGRATESDAGWSLA